MASLNLKWFQQDKQNNKDIVDINLFKSLVNNGDINVNAKYDMGITALHMAIKNRK